MFLRATSRHRNRSVTAVTALLAIALIALAMRTPTVASALDSSWGDGSSPGVAVLPEASSPFGEGLVVDAAGRASVGTADALYRLGANGQIDLTYQSGVRIGPPDSAGRLVFVENSAPIHVRRTASDGTIDQSWGEPLLTSHDFDPHVVIDPDAVTVAGYGTPGGVCLARYGQSTGLLDASFGTGGRTCVGSLPYSDVRGFPLAAGQTLVTALVPTGSLPYVRMFVRFDSSGAIVAGPTSFAIPGNKNPFPATVDHQGRPILAGDGVIVRLTPGWALDTSFNPDGDQPGVLTGSFAGSATVTSDDRVLASVGGGAVLLTTAGDVDGALEASGASPGWIYPSGIPSAPSARVGVSDVAVTPTNRALLNIVGTRPNDPAGYPATVRSDVIGAPQPRPGGLFVPITPTRILETRTAYGQVGYSGPKPIAGQIIDVQVTGRSGIASTGVSAVAVNITAVDATGDGYVTAWPSGQLLPNVSNLNVVKGQTRPNLAIVPVGANGKISVYTFAGADLLVDLQGWFPAGAFRAATPTRVLDTRPEYGPIGYSGAKPADNAIVSVAIAGRAGIAGTGVQAVIANVTITHPDGGSFVTAYASGSALPGTSTLNVSDGGETAANLAIIPVGADGRINLYTYRGSDLIVDVFGWLPIGSGYVPSPPSDHYVDSRRPPHSPLGPDTTRTVSVPAGISVINLTGVSALRDGFLTAYVGSSRPNVSNINLVAGQTAANMAIVATPSNGNISVYSYGGADLVIDSVGLFPSLVA